jgi:hypothetical protein
MNAALLASAQGDWPRASELFKNLLAVDSENYIVSFSDSLVCKSDW